MGEGGRGTLVRHLGQATRRRSKLYWAVQDCRGCAGGWLHLEVLAAVGAGVEVREEVQEGPHLGLLFGGRGGRVVRSHGVQHRPARPACAIDKSSVIFDDTPCLSRLKHLVKVQGWGEQNDRSLVRG